MKLLIPIRNYPNVQHLTIAIRSITAHHTEIDELILIGMAPMPGIKHTLIRFKDYGQIERKAECIRDKVIAAINALKLKEPFLFANDDHIIFGRIDNVYDKGLLSQTLATKKAWRHLLQFNKKHDRPLWRCAGCRYTLPYPDEPGRGFKN